MTPLLSLVAYGEKELLFPLRSHYHIGEKNTSVRNNILMSTSSKQSFYDLSGLSWNT